MKIFSGILVCLIGLVLMMGITDFPTWGDPHSPASSRVSTYYLQNAMLDTNVPNLVTAVLADYRSFDTMMETAVVFIAALAIMFILRRPRRSARKMPTERENLFIVYTGSRMMIPMMQLFALYVVAHGHHSPGGGFQGGVMLGASIILLALATDLKTAFNKINEKSTIILTAVGVLIFAGIGVIAMLYGGKFLEYSAFHPLLPYTDAIMARSHAMLGVEIGVAITVMVAMFSIFADLSSEGKLDRGL